MKVRPLDSERDVAEWLRMRLLLWPDDGSHAYMADLDKMIADDGWEIFVCERPTGGLCGFLEVSIRVDYVEGCESSPVAYIEGWFVDEDLRRQGVGRLLFAAGEAWARTQGLAEIGSDTEIDNAISMAAHEQLGYKIVGRSVHFLKKLSAPR